MSSDEPDLNQALSNLRATVREVSDGGQIDPKKADELNKRVAGLARQVEKKRGEDAAKKMDEMDKYLAGLTEKGELTADEQQRIATALSGVRGLVAPG
jgi:hypothetical protein